MTWKKYDLEAPLGHCVAEAFRSMQTNARIDIAWSDSDLTLEAAHIRPVAHEGEHRVDNGLLLRSDGQEFYNLARQAIDIPERRADRPSREAIEWHMDEVFLSA